MSEINATVKGSVVRYLRTLLHRGQIRDCRHLSMVREVYDYYFVRCDKDWAERVPARNVFTICTGYSAPSSYSWPQCPRDCEHYAPSSDFTATLCGESPRERDSGVFASGEQYDAKRQLTRLVAAARCSIDLADQWIGQELLDILTGKQSGVAVRILAGPKSVTPALKVHLRAFASQYGPLEVRRSADFHDRFLFLDASRIYHFGHSLKDLGARVFRFDRVEKTEEITKLRRLFDQHWSKATVVD